MKHSVASILLVLLTPLTVHADDGYTSVTGGALNFAKNKQIQMVSERVVITMRDDDASIDATFHFVNHGARTTVQMGFPEEADHGQTIDNFKSQVDGKRVRVKRKVLFHPQGEGDYYKAVWLKMVPFAAGQRRTVHVTYGANNCFLESGSMWQEYTLTTGATWAGPIKDCRLIVDYSKVHSPYGVVPRLEKDREQYSRTDALEQAEWTRSKPNVVSTTLVNVKPDFDLFVDILPGFWKFKVNGAIAPLGQAIYDLSEAWPQRRGTDIILNPFAVNVLFNLTQTNKFLEYWGNPWPNPRGVKDPYEINGGFMLPSGKIIPLKRRPFKIIAGYEKQPVVMVYLSDLVKGMGGTYRFDPATGFVSIDLPKR